MATRTINFYKEGDLWILDKTITPAGSYRMKNNGDDHVSIIDLEGKIIFSGYTTEILDSSGNGYSDYESLISAVSDFFVKASLINVVQETGSSEADTMSQKAITDALALKANKLDETLKKEIKLFRDNALLEVISFSFMIDEELNGWSVKSISAYVPVASTSGTPTVTLTNLTTGNTITSTPVTIDENELTSLTASIPAVINPTYKSVATGNLLSVNLTVTGTGAKGMGVIIVFEKNITL